MAFSAHHISKGFTLLELLITIVLLGILSSIAIPSFRNLAISSRLKNATTDITASINYARSEAIKRGANITVTPVSGLWTNGWKIETTLSPVVTLKQQDAAPDLSLKCAFGTDSLSNCAQTLTFSRDGRLSGASGTFFLTTDAPSPSSPPTIAKRCLILSTSGQISVLVDNNLDGNCSNG